MGKRMTTSEAAEAADVVIRQAKAAADATRRLEQRHAFNVKAMRKVAERLKLVIANPDNIIQGPDEGELDWCINVLNNPEE